MNKEIIFLEAKDTSKMDACTECIVYKVHHNLTEPWECSNCGQRTAVWKQASTGTFYAECSNCGSYAVVDLNTPCEQDPIFWQETEIIIEPQSKRLSNQTILDLAKHFHVNASQMCRMLTDGYTVESEKHKIDEYAELFDRNDIAYRIVKPEDPRTKYLYYEKCNYPYSAMKTCRKSIETDRLHE